MKFTPLDVVFELQGHTVAFVANFEKTGWPGVIMRYPSATGGYIQVKAPIAVPHAVQLCAFAFRAIVGKVDKLSHEVEVLRTESERPDADVFTFKPRSDD